MERLPNHRSLTITSPGRAGCMAGSGTEKVDIVAADMAHLF